MNRILLIAMTTLLIVACDEQQSVPEYADPSDSTAAIDPADTNSTAVPVDPDDPSLWLADRYGMAAGTVTLTVVSGGEKTLQRRTFAESGRIEKLEWWYTGTDTSGPAFVSVLRGDTLRFLGPADTAVQSQVWSPELPVALPNFRRLTETMSERFAIEEGEPRTVLGRELVGYRITSRGTTSRLWLDDGLMLYGEIEGIPEKGIEPMIVEAIAIDSSRVDPGVFVLE